METVQIVAPKDIHKCAINHGWYENIDPENPHIDFIPSKLALIHSEISEALQCYRIGEKAGFNKELADGIIRIFDLCAFLDIDIADEVATKHIFNLDRPYKHGGKLV